jgi:hypothetical protein
MNMGNEIVEKLIEAEAKRLAEKFESIAGETEMKERKQGLLDELKKFGDHLKEVFEVKTDSMGLLEIMEKGGVVFRKIVLQKEHMYTSPRPADILERLIHDNALYNKNLPAGDCRVTIIMEPMEPKKE